MLSKNVPMKNHVERYDLKYKPVCKILYLLRGLEINLHVLLNHSKSAAHSMLGIPPLCQEIKHSQHTGCLTSICIQLLRNEEPVFLMFDKKTKKLTVHVFCGISVLFQQMRLDSMNHRELGNSWHLCLEKLLTVHFLIIKTADVDDDDLVNRHHWLFNECKSKTTSDTRWITLVAL